MAEQTPLPDPLPAQRAEGTRDRQTPLPDPLPAQRAEGIGKLGAVLARFRWSFGSGPAVATLFARGLALVSLVAWLSLGVQVQVLIGSHGLLPAADLIEAARAQPGVSLLDLPTLAWWLHSDGALTTGIALGAALSIAAFAGFARRACFALSTLLYLSYVTVTRDFLSFQWDNLLLECGFLAVFLRTDAPAPVTHFLFRLVLFKLYFESGIAKWGSALHDWHDGSAMTYYYETAPLPTWLAWYAHHLPVWWHHLESRATLVLELVIPFGIFGPRRVRLFTFGAFTLFQIVNAATANYGFFCYLAVVLGVFLLDDADVARARAWMMRGARFVPEIARRWRARLARLAGWVPRFASRPLLPASARRWAAVIATGLFALVSVADANVHFGQPCTALAFVNPLLERNWRLHLVNTYHLFASITRERIEPEFQTLAGGPIQEREGDDGAWTAQHFHHKPGDVGRAPNFVAPHQPRVDFRLWFYGLGFQRRAPAYVSALIERLCGEPQAVQPLFRAPLPPHPTAIRLVFWQYQFTSPAEARATGAWWRRTRLATMRAVPCPQIPDDPR
jgi:lipase maturation factor